WGERWEDVANGVPSDFGFCMAVHPHRPETAYIVPLESAGFRATPGARLRVYRTRDAGGSWEPLSAGLPEEDAYETVLRDALDTDALEPAGVYFGTRSGRVYGSRDDGESWSAIREGLPPVTCVRAAVAGPR
ncbi:MAG: WD40/YVTN/BNR-like repeat-containing protein, partial [Gemmatimonadota bacterium]